MKKIIIAIISLAIHASTVLAGSIPDVSNPVGATISATTSISNGDVMDKLDNRGTLSNYFAVYNSGTINSFTNYLDASVLAVQGIVNDAGASIGSLSNAGTFTVDSWGLNNGGTVGTISNTGSIISQYIGIHNSGATTSITLLENSGTITGGVSNAGVNNDQGTITTFTNTGVINGQFGVINTGVITTFNNSQGAYLDLGSSYAERALVYRNNLPVNYNVIINSVSSFGQIAYQDTSGENPASGAMLFDVADGSTVVDQTSYAKVLQGLVGALDKTSNTITGEGFSITYSGLYDGLSYDLDQAGDASLGNWNLVFGLLGPLAEDTQAALDYQAKQLRAVFNMQAAAADFGIQADCDRFDANDLCVSVGGRYATLSHADANNVAGVVTIGWRATPHIRIGAHIDQNLWAGDPAGVDIHNKTPLVGASTVWTAGEDGLGLQLRLANSYQKQDITSTRTVFGTSEAGVGSSSLTTQAYLAEMAYSFQWGDQTVLQPHAGVRYGHMRQAGYAEIATDLVLDPLTFASLVDESVVALLGLKLHHNATEDLAFSLYLGLEQDMYRKQANYVATDLNESELESVDFQSGLQATRPMGRGSATYRFSAGQQISTTVSYQQMPWESMASVAGYVGYAVAF
jgi:hypothetical protein